MNPEISNVIQAYCKMNNVEGEPNLWLVLAAGISVVFIGMILLTAILYIMSAIGKKTSENKKTEKKEETEPVEKADVITPSAEEEDEELLAVIAAAIAAYNEEHAGSSSIKASAVKRLGSRINRERKNG